MCCVKGKRRRKGGRGADWVSLLIECMEDYDGPKLNIK